MPSASRAATGRYGETVDREREVEREGYGAASFEGEAKTSTGRKAEVEGVAGYGAYGRRGAVANVDTKYRGDWTVAAGRGPYGAAVTRLPQGYRPYTYYGRSYYHYGYAYYRPYTYGGVPYYFVVPPPYGVVYTTVPPGADHHHHRRRDLLLCRPCLLQEDQRARGPRLRGGSSAEGSKGFRSSARARHGDGLGIRRYYYYKNTFYRQILREGKPQYAVVNEPQGLVTVNALTGGVRDHAIVQRRLLFRSPRQVLSSLPRAQRQRDLHRGRPSQAPPAQDRGRLVSKADSQSAP